MTRPLNLSADEMYALERDPDLPRKRKAFKSAFKRLAVPWLRRAGFAGNGATFRRFPGARAELSWTFTFWNEPKPKGTLRIALPPP